jgi:hypothetical protein
VEADFIKKDNLAWTEGCIEIWHKSIVGRPIIDFRFYIDKVGYMWANNDESEVSYPSTSFNDIDAIVEEIKRCIDKTTGRPCSVPNPKTGIPFCNDLQKRKASGPLGKEPLRKKTHSAAGIATSTTSPSADGTAINC